MAVDDDAAERRLSESTTFGPAGEDSPPEARAAAGRTRAGLLVGLVAMAALAGLGGWFGYGAYQEHQRESQRQLFLQAGRQGALNLTTIDYQHAEADIQRILDAATGTFYDDFDKRSQPFIEVVKKAQSKSVGTITEAGIESETDSEAQIVVAVSVKTTNVGATEQAPRSWRMRISVAKVDEQAKVSNVAFVP